jgi:fido (protein-threonine AMPylation protein)
MHQLCQKILARIATDHANRRQLLANPRLLHHELFQQFTPPGCVEYAGTYRGAPGTTLEGRAIHIDSQLRESETFELMPARHVEEGMDYLHQTLAREMEKACTKEQRITLLAMHFALFGRIHPFLDGNGHVQRLLFASLAAELGLSLSPKFAVHPRPFGRLLAIALELFSTAELSAAARHVDVIQEYLTFWIE